MSPRGRRALLVAAGLVAGVVVAELVVRAAGVAPEIGVLRRGRFQLSDNPARVYEPVPGSHHDGGDLAFYDYTGDANRLGYRDRDHPLHQTTGTSSSTSSTPFGATPDQTTGTSTNPLRIVVLGDSVAAGLGIERTADVFPARLETELTRRGHAAEVLNFAVSGYNTRQEIETLKDDALAFSPDVVLLAYCLNDHRPPEAKIVDGLRQQAEGRVAVAPGAADRLLAASAVYRLLRYRGDHAGDDALAHLEGEGAAAGVQSAAAFDELAALGREHGFETLVAVFPELRADLTRYPYGNRHRHLAALSAERGFAHLDLLWAYRECQANGETNLALDRYHPSVAGHECAALALADFLEGGLFQPPSP